MEEFKEAKIHYYENEIRHLEQQRYVYERKLEFYSDKLNEIHNKIIKYHGIIQSVEREDYDYETYMKPLKRE